MNMEHRVDSPQYQFYRKDKRQIPNKSGKNEQAGINYSNARQHVNYGNKQTILDEKIQGKDNSIVNKNQINVNSYKQDVNKNHGNKNSDSTGMDRNKTNISQMITSVGTECQTIQLPTIKTQFHDKIYNIMVDSGASVSILNIDLFQEIKDHIKIKYVSRAVTITTLSGHQINYFKTVDLPIKIQGKQFRHIFFVTKEKFPPAYQGILGYDFLQKNAGILDTESNLLKIGNLDIPLNSHYRKDEEQLYNVVMPKYGRLNKKCTLTAKQEKTIYLQCDHDTEDEKQVLFEPLPKSYLNMMMGIYDIKQNQIAIKVTNLTDTQITLNKGMKLGSIEAQFEILNKDKAHQPGEDLKENKEYVNFVQASPEMIRLRREDLKTQDFQLDHMEKKFKDDFLEFLMNYADVFSKSLKTLGATDVIKPTIQLTHEHAIKSRPFDIPFALQKVAKEKLQQLLDSGVISKTSSNFACPLILVRKANGDYRLCLDLRLINNYSTIFPHNIPKINDIITNLAGYKFFTKLDFNSAFNQIILPPETRRIFAFTSPFGNYEYKRMVFGHVSSAPLFQAAMDIILGDLKTEGIQVYIDDIIIPANSYEELKKKTKLVFDKLREYNLTLSPSKCQFFLSKINYLGFLISEDGISPSHDNLKKILSFPTPKTVKKLKRFLGVCNFYRNLIQNYAEITAVLSDLTQKGVKFQWEEKHEQAFQKLQDCFFQQPILIQPDFDQPFYLNTDASMHAVAASLLQYRDGILKPIAYFSRKLSKQESKYAALKTELLAIYQSMKFFRNFLYGRKFYVLSDHKPLGEHLKIENPPSVLQRWLLEISEFKYEFIHIPGRENVLADYLSREDFDQNNKDTENNENIPLVAQVENINVVTKIPSWEMILEEQMKDPKLLSIRESIKENKLKIGKNYDTCYIDQETNLLMHVGSWRDRPYRQDLRKTIVIPKTLQKQILEVTHVIHSGIDKTYKLLSDRYYWVGMFSDTQNFVLSCQSCRAWRGSERKVPYGRTPIPPGPGHTISIDIVGPFRPSVTNKRYILSVVCQFSKHIQLYALTNITAVTVADKLLQYIADFGNVYKIYSDSGVQFTSAVYKSMTDRLQIVSKIVPIRSPYCNGIVERVHSSLKQTINVLTENSAYWDIAIMIHKIIYNSTIHSSTKETPNFLFFGRDLAIPFETVTEQEQIYENQKQYARDKIEIMKNAYEEAMKNLELSKIKQETEQLKKARTRDLNIGDLVFLENKRNAFKKSKYLGLYRITDKLNKFIYLIKRANLPFAQPFKVHVNRIRLLPDRKKHLQNHDEDASIPQQQETNESQNSSLHPTLSTRKQDKQPPFFIWDENTESAPPSQTTPVSFGHRVNKSPIRVEAGVSTPQHNDPSQTLPKLSHPIVQSHPMQVEENDAMKEATQTALQHNLPAPALQTSQPRIQQLPPQTRIQGEGSNDQGEDSNNTKRIARSIVPRKGNNFQASTSQIEPNYTLRKRTFINYKED